ncbi:MAG: hypothetical protein ACYS0E_16510 [Planctomycetota bacterium]
MAVGAQPLAANAADYWVSGTDARWIYLRTDGRAGADPTPMLKTVTDTGEEVIDGKTTRRFEHSLSLFENRPDIEYRHFDGRSIINIADFADTFGVNLPAASYTEVPAPLVDGRTVRIADRTEQIDIDGDGVVDSVRIEVDVTLGYLATFSVPAGDFIDVLTVDTVIVGTATNGATGASARAEGALAAWYAPGVGIIRRVFEHPQYAAPDNRVTEELVGLDAGGLRAGILPGLTLLDDIGDDASAGHPRKVRVAVGNDRTMTIATRTGTVQAAIHRFDESLVWRGVALSAPTGHWFGSVSASFDGTNFRVVAAHSKPFDSPAVRTVVVQRLAADGTLRDGTAGAVLETGIADNTETIGALRTAASQGDLLVTWGRYDRTNVPVGPGLVRSRGYVLEGRLFDAANVPMAPSFELAEALPAAVEVREDQFIVIPTQQVMGETALQAWAVAGDGVPVSLAGNLIDERMLARIDLALHRADGELWLSYGSFDDDVLGPPEATITLARLGRDGVLLDGNPSAPGHELVQDDARRGVGTVGLGGNANVLAWREGYNALQATPFDEAVLVGAAPLPASEYPLLLHVPLQGAGPGRSLRWAGPAGTGVMVVWLETDTPSDRVMATLLLPRLSSP